MTGAELDSTLDIEYQAQCCVESVQAALDCDKKLTDWVDQGDPVLFVVNSIIRGLDGADRKLQNLRVSLFARVLLSASLYYHA